MLIISVTDSERVKNVCESVYKSRQVLEELWLQEIRIQSQH